MPPNNALHLQTDPVTLLAILGTAFFVFAGCTSLSEDECLESPNHTLVVADRDRGYECKVARNECETGFVQSEHGAEVCEANQKCIYVPGRCYCPVGMQCICGGGPPSRCRLKQ